MHLQREHKKTWAFVAGFGLLVFLTAFNTGDAAAKRRHAFIVGIADYDTKSGLPPLSAPANDAQDVKTSLEHLPQPFLVDIITNDQAKDRDTFQAAFSSFLNRVEPGDDVLFYFSGHGFSAESKNFYLLKSAKSNTIYFKDLPAADVRELDTDTKKNARYRDFITTVALSESDIEKAISDRKPEVIIIIADACRSLIEGTKGASLDGQGIVLPAHSAFGTYRLYSASEGQVSQDSLESGTRLDVSSTDYKPQDKNGPKEKARKNSLFTRVLLAQIPVPGQPLLVMAAQVKSSVRKQAQNMGKDQIPDYNEDRRSTDYFFWPAEGDAEVSALCQYAATKLENLRAGIASGALGRDTIQETIAELSRCGADIRTELRSLSRIEAQGTGTFASQNEQTVDVSKLTDPQQICELRGSSPLDPERPQGLAGVDIQKLAAAAVSGEGDRKKSETEIKSIVAACEEASKLRPRVARYKYNAATANYALAGLTPGLERTVSLHRASNYYQEAVDLGYPAAYNGLAVMIQNGDFYKDNSDTPEPSDRDKIAQLLQRGALLNDVVAQYNLGMAYLRGDLGLGNKSKLAEIADVNEKKLVEQKRQATAFKYLSMASEHSYVPAMIETAKLLHDGRGVAERNFKRPIELLEVAAYTGSWEAMYWLGWMYEKGGAQDPQQAILWYARAAEAGDVRSQQHLARMLKEGEGVPAPQPEAAGRYYRLAAYGGSAEAQIELASLLRDNKVQFRPIAEGKPDGGALEIRTLYLSAFAVRYPWAGLYLARLYRTGFPVEQGSVAIPKDPESAVDLLYRTIERVQEASPEGDLGDQANPKIAALAAFELVSMYDKGEAKRRDGSAIITEDQIKQLRERWGSGSNVGYIRAGSIGTVVCGERTDWSKVLLLVWDWDREEPPTDQQLLFLERYNNCAERAITWAKEHKEREPRPEDTGFTREYRNKILYQFRAARDDAKRNGAKAKSFYERMADLVNVPDEGYRRRRRR